LKQVGWIHSKDDDDTVVDDDDDETIQSFDVDGFVLTEPHNTDLFGRVQSNHACKERKRNERNSSNGKGELFCVRHFVRVSVVRSR